MAFPLEHNRRDLSLSERSDRVRQLLSEVGMEGDLKKMPSDISGGMQKRVGLARALALKPEILLLDEPTAGVDPASAAMGIESVAVHACPSRDQREAAPHWPSGVTLKPAAT